ncbi:MAG: 2-C-methyl-D-erythritol 4-phosphate cytidylyltransferase [Actinomycetota bacterium]
MSKSPISFVAAILLAGGSGERFGGEVPKQFVEVAGVPMFEHPLATFDSLDAIGAVVLVVPAGSDVGDLSHFTKLVSVVTGGATRQASVAEGLIALPEATDAVLVHDAARPAVTAVMVRRVLDGLISPFKGCIPVIPIQDAIKEVSMSNEVLASKARTGLWRAQTPQAFDREAFEQALARCDADGFSAEDCSQMLLRNGARVTTVEGDPMNIKVTTGRDIALCEAILTARKQAWPMRAQ